MTHWNLPSLCKPVVTHCLIVWTVFDLNLLMAMSISASFSVRVGWTQARYMVVEPRVEEDTRYSRNKILASE